MIKEEHQIRGLNNEKLDFSKLEEITFYEYINTKMEKRVMGVYRGARYFYRKITKKDIQIKYFDNQEL